MASSIRKEETDEERKARLKRTAAIAGGLVAAGGLVGVAAGKRLGEANVLRMAKKNPNNLAKIVGHATGGKDLHISKPGLVRRIVRAARGQDVYAPDIRIG